MAKPNVRSGGTLSFGAAVASFADQTVERMDQVHRGVFLKLADKVIMGTPFGDPSTWKYPAPKDYVPGLARGNWQTRSNAIPPATVLPIRPAHDAYAEAEANAGKAGDVTYMLNSVPYILRLEYQQPPHSMQAPAGMVRINVASFQQQVDEYVRSLK